MVILGVDDIDDWDTKLAISLDVPFSTFREPDIGNKITAIAVSPSVDNKIFKDLRLL